jgi:ABC-type multidrug transport system ATPase subunit
MYSYVRLPHIRQPDNTMASTSPSLADTPIRFRPVPTVVADHLTKRFGATTAVKNVSLEVYQGKITALLGGNGAGKSTLTRILSRTQSPNEGRLLIEGRPIEFANYSPQHARSLGIRVVHQELSLCTNLTVAENVLLEFGSAFRGVGWRGKAESAIKGALDAIFPQNRVNTRVEAGSLSLAERQMVEIARAALDPRLRLLILDEPTSSLDARRAHQLLAYLRERSDAGLSVIFIGHRLGEILDLAQEFLVMRDGWQPLASGRPREPQPLRRAGHAYLISGALAAFGGVLLSARVGGAFLEMGNPFLLQSVGAVVVGGSSIFGGRSTALGTFLGSIFLVMVVTTMQVLRLAGGLQEVAQGILIILVLAVARASSHK